MDLSDEIFGIEDRPVSFLWQQQTLDFCKVDAKAGWDRETEGVDFILIFMILVD